MFMMNNTNKHSNGSVDHHSDNESNSTPGTIVIINCVLNAPLMLLSILGNALVLAAIIRTPSIRSTSMIMLCSLAVSDLLVGFLAQPINIAMQLCYYRLSYNFHIFLHQNLSNCSSSSVTNSRSTTSSAKFKCS